MNDDNTTLDPAHLRRSSAIDEAAVIPWLELLFHADPRRIGQQTLELGLDGRGECLVGRKTPVFGGATGPWAPLEDPFISREQLRLRFLRAERAFEVSPHQGARQPLELVSPGVDPRAVRLDAPARVPAGALLAVGKRVLLRLACGRPRAPAADRLGMIGESEALWAVRDQIRVIAGFRASVLILGETGTGKELCARAIHASSGAAGRFLALNMGGIEAGTAGSQLFGHVRGAFTSAHRDEPGAFQEARGGTLFLDEIGDLALELQKKLLRVLEDRSFSPIGSSKRVEVDCRVLAATHRPLGAEIAAGGFRRDLFERLGALSITTPALRERREDVPRLFFGFLGEQAREHPELARLVEGDPAAPAPPVPMDFVVALLERPWPGNIRELKNLAIATAAANVGARRFVAPPDPRVAPARSDAEPSGDAPRPGSGARAFTDAEMEEALRCSNGNVQAAAGQLGCSRHQLYRLLGARGIDVERFRRG